MAGKLPFLSLGSVRAKFLAFVSIMHDVTERKQAEQELVESQEHLQALADYLQVALSSISDGIAIFDGHLNYFAFNQRYVDLLDFPEGLVREGGSIVDAIEFAAKRGDYESWLDGEARGASGHGSARGIQELRTGEGVTPTAIRLWLRHNESTA